MRRIPLIFGLVLVTGLILHDIYEFFVTNEGIRYFSSEPRRLLYAMLLGVVGAMVTLGISRLSPAPQRHLKLCALGGFGALLVVGVAFFGHLFHRLIGAERQDGLGWVWTAWAVAFVPMTVVAVLVWMEFRQVWRQTR